VEEVQKQAATAPEQNGEAIFAHVSGRCNEYRVRVGSGLSA
jgi:hypothetical protein